MLERNVEIGQYLALSHKGYDFVNVGVGVHVMQARPDTKAGKGLSQLRHVGFYRLAVPEAGTEFCVNAVGTGVL